MVLQAIANAITKNNPECHLMVVLVDERPEEVTDMQRSVKGEVIHSTFDRPADDHTMVAELAIERAKRVVERGGDSAVIVDSLEALAAGPARRVFGAARNTDEGGSLTVFASIGMAPEPQRVATTRIALEPPTPDSPAPRVSPERSGTLQAERLR
jgi:transcription termination factor Rho